MVYTKAVKKRIRTQIYLEEQQRQWLKLEAMHRRTSMSDLIRDAVSNLAERERKRVDWANDPITKLIGFIKPRKDGENDWAEEHDHYLYGAPKGQRWKK